MEDLKRERNEKFINEFVEFVKYFYFKNNLKDGDVDINCILLNMVTIQCKVNEISYDDFIEDIKRNWFYLDEKIKDTIEENKKIKNNLN